MDRRTLARKIGLFVVSNVVLFLLLVWLPVIPSGEDERVPLQGYSAVTRSIQATATSVDPTVTALNKVKLTRETDQLQRNWDNWWWNNGLAFFSTLFSTLAIVLTVVFGLWRWFKDRDNEQNKRSEERLQSVIEGLASESMEAKVGGAIMLRTFLRPRHEEFYNQVFDLVVAHLRLQKHVHSEAMRNSSIPNQTTVAFRDRPLQDQQHTNSGISDPSDSLSQALTAVFTEAFRVTRNWLVRKPGSQFNSESLDATGVHLDKAYLCGVDLKGIWMPRACLQGADLSGAELSNTILEGTDFTDAKLCVTTLVEANLVRAILVRANLESAVLRQASLDSAQLKGAKLIKADLTDAVLVDRADLTGVDFTGANLTRTDFTGAILTGTHPEAASTLTGAKFRNVVGLDDVNQHAACVAMGACFDGTAGVSGHPASSNTP